MQIKPTIVELFDLGRSKGEGHEGIHEDVIVGAEFRGKSKPIRKEHDSTIAAMEKRPEGRDPAGRCVGKVKIGSCEDRKGDAAVNLVPVERDAGQLSRRVLKTEVLEQKEGLLDALMALEGAERETPMLGGSEKDGAWEVAGEAEMWEEVTKCRFLDLVQLSRREVAAGKRVTDARDPYMSVGHPRLSSCELVGT